MQFFSLLFSLFITNIINHTVTGCKYRSMSIIYYNKCHSIVVIQCYFKWGKTPNYCLPLFHCFSVICFFACDSFTAFVYVVILSFVCWFQRMKYYVLFYFAQWNRTIRVWVCIVWCKKTIFLVRFAWNNLLFFVWLCAQIFQKLWTNIRKCVLFRLSVASFRFYRC